MLRAAWRRIVDAPPRAVLAAAWIAAVVYGYPGKLPLASVDLLQHARAPHPPFASFVWHLLEYVIAGPAGMLLAQVTLAIAGAYSLLQASQAPRRAAWLTAALVVSPPVLVSLATVSSASLATALLLAGAAALPTNRRLGLAALGLAAAVHPAAIAAALPILVLTLGNVRALALWVGVAAFGLVANAGTARHAPSAHGAELSLVTAAPSIDPPTAPDDVLLKLGVPTEHSLVRDGLDTALDALPLVYTPWLYLAAALALGVWRRRDRTALALLGAGVAFEAVALFTAPDATTCQSAALFACTLLVAYRGYRGRQA